MAIFRATPGRGSITHLVLQDPATPGKNGKPATVWARAENGVLELADDLAARFREIAHLYGYLEQDAAAPAPASEPPQEQTPADAVPAEASEQ